MKKQETFRRSIANLVVILRRYATVFMALQMKRWIYYSRKMIYPSQHNNSYSYRLSLIF
jgi:hypothetical protein